MDHLMNCHGEWAVLLAALTNLPLVGIWIRGHLRTAQRVIVTAEPRMYREPHQGGHHD